MRHLITVLFTLGLTACSSVSVEDYRDRQPAFSPEQFFAGALTAHGVVKDYKGYAVAPLLQISPLAGKTVLGHG